MATSLDDLLRIATRELSAAGAAHALIGGCARNVFAAPRATRAVDIEDVVRFQRAAGAVIDWAYVEGECAQWDALDVLKGPRERAGVP